MSRRYDNDGIDGPIDKAWDAAIREDAERRAQATAPKCKRCKCEGWMLTDAQRVEDHAKLLALVSGPIDWTCRAEQSLSNPLSPTSVLAHTWHLAGRLVAADQGLCVHCTEFVEGPAT